MKNESNTDIMKDMYRIIFEKKAFSIMHKGHRRRLYTEMAEHFNPPVAASTFKGWFLYPEQILDFKDEKRDYILAKMLECIVKVMSAILEEMKEKQTEVDLFTKTYSEFLTHKINSHESED